jgi:predicted 2-oxoglutarate/Fe(II)-dependent dioxygenase YbiX
VGLTRDIAALLETIERPGDFYVAGEHRAPPPELAVLGEGWLEFPLAEAQLKRLIALAERAPYGRGPRTLVDLDVRRAWQIDADRLQLRGGWEETLAAIVERAREGLGVPDAIDAELYKLLIYEPGDFFLEHRDSEKTAGMFGTLVITLPSPFSGGVLALGHGDQEVRLELPADAGRLSFAAFYADCTHALRPVTAGYRVALVYNLRRKKRGRLAPPDYRAETARLAERLQRWRQELEDEVEGTPRKLIAVLQHRYTPAGLDFGALKGADLAAAGALWEAADQADCVLHLAMISIEESGAAEHRDGGYHPRRRRWGYYDDEEDEDDLVVGEIIERVQLVTTWRTPDGRTRRLPDVPFEDEELCPPGALQGQEPDEQSFWEASGNAGASFERSYRRAALVLWPEERWLPIVSQLGTSRALEALRKRIERGAREEGRALAQHIIDDWPGSGPRFARHLHEDPVKALRLLTALGDRGLLAQLIARVIVRGSYGAELNEALLAAWPLLGPEVGGALIRMLLEEHLPQAFTAAAPLLEGLSALGPPAALRGAATAMAAGLPLGYRDYRGGWSPSRETTPEAVSSALAALWRIDAEAAARAIDFILSRPTVYSVDAVLTPTCLRLVGLAGPRPGLERLTEACAVDLHERIAQPLAPPRDHTREFSGACRCKDCEQLRAFMEDPDAPSWRFRARQSRRAHLESELSRYKADASCATDRGGGTHTLVVSKNQASYERRRAQRQADLAALAALGLTPGPIGAA